MKEKNTFKKTVFPNGLTLVTEYQDLRSLSIGIWVKVGTRYEGKREAGVSHLLEHMLFKGTEKRSALDIAREVDRVGGEFNAFTGREYTCFHMLLLEKDLGLGAEILSDILLHSAFDPEELDRERKVILQEITMIDESPEELVHDYFFEKCYGRHGLGKPILGTEASIKRLSRREILHFFRNHYAPSQTIVSVVGDISHLAVKKKIRALSRGQWFGRSGKKPRAKELGFEPAPALKNGNWWYVDPGEQVHIVWGVPGPAYAAKDRYAMHLLNVYLGGGMSSALFQEIREKNGLAYTVYSNLSPFIDSGVFTVYAATAPNQVSLCLKLMNEIFTKTKNDLLSPKELSEIKESLKGTIILSSDSSESRMFSIARNHMFFQRNIPLEELCREIDAVTAQDIRKAARKILRPDKASLVFMGPRPGKQLKSRLKPLKIIK